MRSRSVSLTGATGLVGWHAALALRERGWQVRGIVRPGSRKALPDGVERVEAVLDARVLVRVFDGSDVVVHAAGLTRAFDEHLYTTVNVDATRSAVEAANDAGARFVLISSQAAGGTGTAARPRREDQPPRPLTEYGRSKLAGEEVVRAVARVPWTILRPSAAYGPRDRQFLPLLRLASRGLFLLAARPDTHVSLIYVGDLADAIATAVDGGSAADAQTMYVAHPRPVSVEAILRGLATTFGRSYRPRQVPRPLLRALARMGDALWWLGQEPMLDSARLQELSAEGFVCSVDRAREALGFTAATALPEGLEQTVRWCRDRGWV